MIGHFFYGLRHHLPKGRATFICFYSPSSIMEVSLEIGHRGTQCSVEKRSSSSSITVSKHSGEK